MSGVRNSSTLAIKLATKAVKSLAEAARDLDLGETLLRGWKTALAQAADHALTSNGYLPVLKGETRLLHSEILEDSWLDGVAS